MINSFIWFHMVYLKLKEEKTAEKPSSFFMALLIVLVNIALDNITYAI